MMTICSSAFAEQIDIQKIREAVLECKLNTERWQFVEASQKNAVYFDTKSITFENPTNNDVFDVWVCYYQLGLMSCNYPFCLKAKIDTSKHYHYARIRFNSRAYTYNLLVDVIRDSQNEKKLDSYTYSPLVEVISPESTLENIMVVVKKHLQNIKETK